MTSRMKTVLPLDARCAVEHGLQRSLFSTTEVRHASLAVEERPCHLFRACALRVLGLPAHGGSDAGTAARVIVEDKLFDRSGVKLAVFSTGSVEVDE